MTAHARIIIGTSSSVGTYGPDQKRTPEVLRRHGLLDGLRAAGAPATNTGRRRHDDFP